MNLNRCAYRAAVPVSTGVRMLFGKDLPRDLFEALTDTPEEAEFARQSAAISAASTQSNVPVPTESPA